MSGLRQPRSRPRPRHRARLTSVVVLATRSRTKTLATPSSSSAERLSAPDRKTTRLPSPEMLGVKEPAMAGAPPAPVARLTSVVVLATRSRTKTLATPSSSSAERLWASRRKTTRLPSPEMLGVKEPAMAGAPPAPVARLTSVVVLATRSRTKTLATPSSSSAERLSAPDRKTTLRPSSEMSGLSAAALAAAPPDPEARLTSVVVLATRSRTKTLATPSSSSAERLSAPTGRRPGCRRPRCWG